MKVHIYNSDFTYINTRYLDEVLENEVPSISEEELDRIEREAQQELKATGRYWLTACYYLVPADKPINR